MSYENIIISKLTEDQKDEVIYDLIDELKHRDADIEKLKERISYPEVSPEDSRFDCLAVTQVNVWPFKENPSIGHVRGLASVVLNDQLTIRGLRVMDGENGLFVGYPNDPFFKGDEIRSITFPLTRQLREHIENCVLEKYQAEKDKEEN